MSTPKIGSCPILYITLPSGVEDKYVELKKNCGAEVHYQSA
jgi:hypothetical protein